MKKTYFYAAVAAAAVAPIAVCAEEGFVDIPATSEYAKATTWLQQIEAVKGYPDQTFRPYEPLSRQHFLMLLSKVVQFEEKRPALAFHDVASSSSYSEVIRKAYQAGFIDGDAGYFHPQKPITRAQAAKILTKALQLEKGEETSFLDVTEAHWAYDYIQTLAAHKLTTQEQGYFKPNEVMTRGQMALMLYRFLGEEINMVGNWTGSLAVGQGALTIQLHVYEDGTAAISVPAQGLIRYPVQSVVQNGGELQVNVQLGNSQIRITGQLQQNELVTTYAQDGMTMPLTFTRYEEQAVTYEPLTIAVDGGELKVALQLPEEMTEAVPLAIIIAGSGSTTKDGNGTAGENNSLKMLAEALAEQGIATIRYDKRGVGENMQLVSREEDLSIDQYARDVEQIIEQLQGDERFTTTHIIGHSEGALVGLIAATQAEVASYTSVAGLGRTIDEGLLEQLSAQLPPELLTVSEEILAQLKAGRLVADVPEVLYSVFRPSVQPYLISWMQYDPVVLLQSLQEKALIVQGKQDLQVSVADAERLKAYAPAAELVYFPSMNHVLKDVAADVESNYAAYANPTLPLSEGLIEAISTFIQSK